MMAFSLHFIARLCISGLKRVVLCIHETLLTTVTGLCLCFRFLHGQYWILEVGSTGGEFKNTVKGDY